MPRTAVFNAEIPLSYKGGRCYYIQPFLRGFPRECTSIYGKSFILDIVFEIDIVFNL